MNNYKSIADVLNAFGVQAFANKSGGKSPVVSFASGPNERRFLNRERIQKEDGTQVWAWVVGKEMRPAEPQAEQPQVQVAA